MQSELTQFPKITVVTPSYNQAQYLETTILSVIGQCYPNLEYLVMDGGSTDGSVEIIERYAEHITYWESAADEGQADAINRGFARAGGEILCWVNSDDYLMPGVLRKVARVLEPSVGQCALIYGNCLLFRESDHSARILRSRPFNPVLLRETDYIYQPSAYWTRVLWEKTGPLKTKLDYVFDWEWFIRASEQCEFRPLDEILSAYRRHVTNKTGTGGEKRRAEIFKLVQQYGNAEQIRTYEYAMAKYSDYTDRNRLANRLKDWGVPCASTIARALSPALWFQPKDVSEKTFANSIGSLG
jgi:glycosyltransferase involved in cell wall biosynthesis